MPELPEVETTRLGISPWIVGKKIKKVIIRERRFRWKIQDDLEKKLEGKKIQSIKRRAKYLIFDTDYGSAIIHLGMSLFIFETRSRASIKRLHRNLFKFKGKKKADTD